MFKLFRNQFSALLALLSLSTMNTSLMAQDYYYPSADNCCYSCVADECNSACNSFYIGAFGGINYSNRAKLSQTGVAFFSEAEGGPLAVDARGHSNKKSSGFGGVKIGYEWSQSPLYSCSSWNLTTAAEIEAFWYSHRKSGHLINPTLRLPEHDFVDTFPMDVGVYLVNGVITINSCNLGKFSPYIGGGIGAANLRIRNAKSLQVSPVELGVDHFNSKRNDHDWSFAAQGKVGLRYNIWEKLHLFAEYRFLFVDGSRYNFGSTVYPTHAPTTTWIVDVKNFWYNAFAVGLQFSL